MKKLYILVGPSGTGKSTKAKTLTDTVCEADNYWLNCVGDYLFVPSKLGDAHKWCQNEVKTHMENGVECIAVANTNLTHKERLPYINMAKTFGYDWEIVLPDSPWFLDMLPRIIDKTFTDKDVQILVGKNLHGVPEEGIRRMLNRFDLND